MLATIIRAGPADSAPQLYIDNLGVAQTELRKGLGSRLVRELMAWEAEQGCAGSWVATEDDNLPAIGLYRSLGAQPAPMVYFEFVACA